nr:MAG TPA: hypothetical protein [Caudoviricetes sp.]
MYNVLRLIRKSLEIVLQTIGTFIINTNSLSIYIKIQIPKML